MESGDVITIEKTEKGYRVSGRRGDKRTADLIPDQGTLDDVVKILTDNDWGGFLA
jgi:hypothetical protein